MKNNTIQLLITSIAILYFLTSLLLVWFYVYRRLPRMKKSIKMVETKLKDINEVINKNGRKKMR